MPIKKMWGGRFEKAASELVDEFGASISFDQEMAKEDIMGSLAHVKMLKATNILSATDADQIIKGLEELKTELADHGLHFTVANEDIHMNIEALLTEKIGPVAGKLHTGRSRNDQVATDFHLYIKERLPKVVAAIKELQQALVRLASENVETIMPGYTHMQHAQPISYGHYLMAYFQMFQRDVERFQFNQQHTDLSPLGAAALVGTTFPIDRQMTADLLGFKAPYANSLDAVSDRDLKIIVGSNSTLNLDADIKVKIKIQNFYGIEINDFAVSVARTAMWIAESQMWAESQNIIYSRDDFLPLDSNDSIFEGNALRMDWSEIVEPYDVNYIMGNPPFVGQSYRSNEQKQDMIDIFGKGSRETKQDYVICWYKKSLDYVSDYKNSSVKCAFVSTNSICQGECVPTFWKDMINAGVEIQFARRTFIWTNEAKNKAAVHCVIVGYSFHKINNIKELYDGGKLTKCDHINPYLVPEEDIWISSRPKRPKDKSKMTTGSPATDDGQLFLSPEEAKTMSKEYPILSKYIRPFIGAHEFLHDLNERTRYCLWFADVGDELPKIIKADHMKDRFQHIKEKRLSSSASRIKKAAETPWLFAQNRQPDTEYLVIPRHSSENREYIPIGFMDPKTIAGDATTIVYDATLEDFAILESSLHVAWMKTVAGRLKSDYRYSSSVYYNFPMPKLTNELKEKLEKSAEGILNARANHPSLSLADMYKELLMPSDLRDAHRKNDKLILQAYGLNKDATDQDILKVLFKMYNNKDNDWLSCSFSQFSYWDSSCLRIEALSFGCIVTFWWQFVLSPILEQLVGQKVKISLERSNCQFSR